MSEPLNIRIYGVWYRQESGEGGWMMDTSARFISSCSKGEMVAYRRQMCSGTDALRYAVASFGDDGFPEIEETR